MPEPAAKPATPAPVKPPWWRGPAFWISVISAAMLGVVGAWMLTSHLKVRHSVPLDSPQLEALKAKLQANPRDEALKQQVRRVDREVRENYFRNIRQKETGAFLLIASLGLFLLAANQARARVRKGAPPRSKEDPWEREARARGRMRWALASMGVVVASSFIAVAYNSGTRLTSSTQAVAQPSVGTNIVAAAKTIPPPTAEELRRQWPFFRGLNGAGVAMDTNLPLVWNTTNGQNILWKSEVPGPGFNSPVVWGDRVFVSGGDKAKREVFCFHAENGKLLWRSSLDLKPPPKFDEWEMPEMSGIASPSMAVDGQRAYVMYANGDLGAFDFEGKQVWAKGMGLPDNQYGHSSSLTLWQGRLIVQFDQGDHGGQGPHKSRLYAFDGATGKVVWEKERAFGSSWASPTVAETAEPPQIILLSIPTIVSYAAADGSELWRVEGLNGEVTPSALYAGGLFIAFSPSEKVFAIKPGGKGDITKTHIAWSAEDSVPDIASPASNGELLFTLTTSGVITCYDMKDGRKLWEHDYETDCHACPVVAGDRLYMVTQKGMVYVLSAGREYKELAQGGMGEQVSASPAIAGGKIFVRGFKNLFCIGTAPAK